MKRAKPVVCTGEKRDAYKKGVVKPEEHDRLEDVKVEFSKDNIDIQ